MDDFFQTEEEEKKDSPIDGKVFSWKPFRPSLLDQSDLPDTDEEYDTYEEAVQAACEYFTSRGIPGEFTVEKIMFVLESSSEQE